MTLLDSIYLKAEALRIPVHVLLELTQRCNEACIHCYIKGARDKFTRSCDDIELSLSHIEKLLDDLVCEGTLNLTFTGGEAMIREDFFDIARLAKDRNFAITIFSNGQIIDENRADRLVQIMPVCVYFSLYGACSDTHDSVTRLSGSFDRLINTIHLLKERKINVGLKTVVTKGNFHHLEEIFALGKALGAETHEFGEEITSKIDGTCQVKMAQVDDTSIYDYYKGDIPTSPSYIEDLHREEALKKPVCGAGVFGVCVSCYGDVYPCAEWRIPLGNIKYESFREIWRKDDGFLAELRSIKTYKDLSDCQHCSLVGYCRRCPGRAVLDAGDWRLCYENTRKRAFISKRVNEEMEVIKDVKEGI